jgi:hypothetical protein
MRPSRGMGAVKASKMPKAKTITRKDDPNEVTMYAKGGKLDIAKAIKKPGALRASLRASLGTKKGETIPAKKLAKAAKAPGKLGQRARFAEMLKGFRKK